MHNFDQTEVALIRETLLEKRAQLDRLINQLSGSPTVKRRGRSPRIAPPPYRAFPRKPHLMRSPARKSSAQRLDARSRFYERIPADLSNR